MFNLTKHQCRVEARKRRKSHSLSYRKFAKIQLLQNLIRSRFGLKYKSFGLYMPMKTEIDILPCLNYLKMLKKTCYLPQTSAIRTQKRLNFSELNVTSQWYLNAYGIREIYSSHYVKAQQLDVLFMPLLGFDQNGYRLGMGGGFYDSTLAYLKYRKMFKKPLRVGIAFDNQLFEQSLQFDCWDIPVDYVLTESKIYKFKRLD